MAYLTFAEKGANKWFRWYGRRFPIERDEFISAAYLGLTVAARKFDASRGCKFSTMAFHWIDQSLGRVVMHHKRQNGYGKFSGGIGGMEQRLVIAQIPEVTHINGKPTPFDLPSGETENDRIESIEAQEMREIAMESAKTARDRTILAGYLDKKTLREIGEEIGMSHESVRQLLPPILERMQQHVNRRLAVAK